MPSLMNLNNLKGLELKIVLEEINKMLIVAAKHDGWVFGGYVRDVIVPLQKDKIDSISFKNIDLWFKNQINFNNFYLEMRGKLYHNYCMDEYYLIHNDFDIGPLHFLITKELPVDDFDIHQVKYCYPYDNAFNVNDPILVDKISNKQATIQSSYIEKIQNDKSHFDRLVNKFLKCGWTIKTIDDIEIPQNVNIEWFMTNFDSEGIWINKNDKKAIIKEINITLDNLAVLINKLFD